jgi:Zn-dependent protease with chaperone function
MERTNFGASLSVVNTHILHYAEKGYEVFSFDELELIIYHELGHIMLGHITKFINNRRLNRIRMEHEADRYAVKTLRASSYLILSTYRKVFNSTENYYTNYTTHPSAFNRLGALGIYIHKEEFLSLTP